jgi:hypothetical protein
MPIPRGGITRAWSGQPRPFTRCDGYHIVSADCRSSANRYVAPVVRLEGTMRFYLAGLALLHIACATGRSQSALPPAVAAAVGCYEVPKRFLPAALAAVLPDSMSLLPDRDGSRFAVRTTPAYRERSRAWHFTWEARNDSLWVYQGGDYLWSEYRLARSELGWRGVIVGGGDIIVPDSLLRHYGPVYFRRIACIGFS